MLFVIRYWDTARARARAIEAENSRLNAECVPEI